MLDQPVTKRARPRGLRSAVALLSTVTVASVGLGALAAQADAGDPAGTIRTVAGTTIRFMQGGFEGDGAQAKMAQLYNPRSVAFGPNGDYFIADALNQRIRRVDASGIITTVAGSAPIDPADSKPVTDANGNPQAPQYAGDGGPALQARLWEPHGVAVDSQGNLYIADSRNHRIRMVTTDGTISTIAGDGNPQKEPCAGNFTTCDAADAGVKFPKNMYMAPGDQLYVADSGNHMIRKIDLTKSPRKITTMAGRIGQLRYGGDGGPATNARLNTPEGLWVTGDGTIYIADSDNNLVRKVDPSGTITTIAGDKEAAAAAATNNSYPLVGDSAGDNGPASSAHVNGPRAVAVDAAGNVYIGEEEGARIRRINPQGTIHTIAGTGRSSPQSESAIKGDPGPSPATEAEFNTMHDLDIDANGDLWIADSKNNRVRVIYGPAGAGTSTPPVTPPTTQPGGGNVPSGKSGYWMLGNDGKIYAFGDARSMGDPSAALAGRKAVHVEPTPSTGGYWVLDNEGNVYAYGDAQHKGNVTQALSRGEKVTSLSSTPTGQGYWIFTTKGRVITFGDAAHFGDMSGTELNGPVRGSIATPSGKGYYMVASDGGVFAFGDAVFRGSMGGTVLNKPVESLVPTRGAGYWLVASDGGVFAFGDAGFRGSMGGSPLNKPMVGMVRYGNGYMMVAADGGIFNYSDKPFAGSLGSNPPENPIVFAATLDS